MVAGRLACLAAALMLAACTRPLAPGEAAFAADLFGDTLDLAPIRVTKDLGLLPLPPAPHPPPAPAAAARPPLPARPCERTPSLERGPPAAFVIGNRIHLVGRFYRDDLAQGWPGPVRAGLAMLLAHELTHVWQWQQRAVTGYHPGRAFAEGLGPGDPYHSAPDDARPFLARGFEQQAALVEDYVCHALLDRRSPRFAELAALLAPHLPVEGFAARRP